MSESYDAVSEGVRRAIPSLSSTVYEDGWSASLEVRFSKCSCSDMPEFAVAADCDLYDAKDSVNDGDVLGLIVRMLMVAGRAPVGGCKPRRQVEFRARSHEINVFCLSSLCHALPDVSVTVAGRGKWEPGDGW